MDRNNITSGQIIYAPADSNVTPVPLTPGAQTSATPTRIESMVSFDCGNPDATITNPAAGTILSGAVAIYGTATDPDFQFYRLQVSGSGTNDADFATLNSFFQPVINGQLGTVPTDAFAPGDYWLRLSVVDNSGQYRPQCTVQVRFD